MRYPSITWSFKVWLWESSAWQIFTKTTWQLKSLRIVWVASKRWRCERRYNSLLLCTHCDTSLQNTNFPEKKPCSCWTQNVTLSWQSVLLLSAETPERREYINRRKSITLCFLSDHESNNVFHALQFNNTQILKIYTQSLTYSGF